MLKKKFAVVHSLGVLQIFLTFYLQFFQTRKVYLMITIKIINFKQQYCYGLHLGFFRSILETAYVSEIIMKRDDTPSDESHRFRSGKVRPLSILHEPSIYSFEPIVPIIFVLYKPGKGIHLRPETNTKKAPQIFLFQKTIKKRSRSFSPR
jgi:hypothetical protein